MREDRRSSGPYCRPHWALLAGCALLFGSLTAGAQAPVVNATNLEPIAISASAPASGPRLRPGEPIPPEQLEAFVDATVRLGMDEVHVAGAAVSIVQNGRVVLNKGYGFASFEPAAAASTPTPRCFESARSRRPSRGSP